MPDIHTPHVWCPIHNSQPLPLAETGSCGFCRQAAREKRVAVQLQNALATPGRCGFCGGPTPCLKEA